MWPARVRHAEVARRVNTDGDPRLQYCRLLSHNPLRSRELRRSKRSQSSTVLPVWALSADLSVRTRPLRQHAHRIHPRKSQKNNKTDVGQGPQKPTGQQLFEVCWQENNQKGKPRGFVIVICVKWQNSLSQNARLFKNTSKVFAGFD